MRASLRLSDTCGPLGVCLRYFLLLRNTVLGGVLEASCYRYLFMLDAIKRLGNLLSLNSN